MKNLYEVEVTATIYVMAESRRKAESIAEWEPDSSDFDYYAKDVSACYGHFESEIPYGTDDDRTVGEIMEGWEEERKAQVKEQEKQEYLKRHAPELPFEWEKSGAAQS